MDKTVEQFKTLLTEVEELRNKEKQLIAEFEQSTGELSKIFHYIIESILEDRVYCQLSIFTCPTHLAEKLEKMGFDVFPNRNCFDALDGYKFINLHLWKELGE